MCVTAVPREFAWTDSESLSWIDVFRPRRQALSLTLLSLSPAHSFPFELSQGT